MMPTRLREADWNEHRCILKQPVRDPEFSLEPVTSSSVSAPITCPSPPLTATFLPNPRHHKPSTNIFPRHSDSSPSDRPSTSFFAQLRLVRHQSACPCSRPRCQTRSRRHTPAPWSRDRPDSFPMSLKPENEVPRDPGSILQLQSSASVTSPIHKPEKTSSKAQRRFRWALLGSST
jgi:hypothetical protein